MKSQKLGFLRSVLFKWQSQATLIGKAVLPVLLLIRLVTLGCAVQTAWLNDEEEFVCKSMQPGCSMMCYNHATLISPIRLWTLQLLLVWAPGLVFLCYLIHLTNQESQVKTRDGEVKGQTLGAYLACVAFVILVEVGFVVAQPFLYSFLVRSHFVCEAVLCPFTTECNVPHAEEKSVFLVIMFTASCVSLLLNVVELVYVLLRTKTRQRQLTNAEGESEVEERGSFLTQLLALWHSHAGLLGKTVLPVLQLIRLVIVGAAVHPLWFADSLRFVCQTTQPGCKQAAFSTIFPVSLLNYWTLQVITVLAPGLVFFCYLVNIIVTEKESGPRSLARRCVLGAYLGLLIAVVLLEVGFAVGQVRIHGYSLSTTYRVATLPCPHIVQCHIFQATEKTVFMIIMFSMALLSALLTLVEMCTVLKREKPWRRSHNKTSEPSGFQMSSLQDKADTTEDKEKR